MKLLIENLEGFLVFLRIDVLDSTLEKSKQSLYKFFQTFIKN